MIFLLTSAFETQRTRKIARRTAVIPFHSHAPRWQLDMKTPTNEELRAAAGDYVALTGFYQRVKSLPFLGMLACNIDTLIAGQWTEVIVEYTVGGSGLADRAWIKGTFEFYSDWALFQTSDPTKDNFVSAEYVPSPLLPGQDPATVQGLSVRFDQKGHERPFQKAIIVDIVDGYLNPGDKIVVRLGDRRFGARGTRAQTFVEDKFLMRWYIDPVGTSRFAATLFSWAIPKARPRSSQLTGGEIWRAALNGMKTWELARSSHPVHGRWMKFTPPTPTTTRITY
ncbi:hypothetical protein MPH_09278 [Macrophomina phaseolina MS6]|uniref:Uncharacterized protein n=1 Tax=Macrophomina phaseolina (strain MS6) TaxID=1126212 RepID=K2RLB6_MACPH|nr:hypothetical protein MPH_09278 [Macrophomina phaseolina MS6]